MHDAPRVGVGDRLADLLKDPEQPPAVTRTRSDAPGRPWRSASTRAFAAAGSVTVMSGVADPVMSIAHKDTSELEERVA